MRDLGLDFTEDMEQAARALNDANVALYAVDARGLMSTLTAASSIPSAEVGPPQSGQLRMPMGAAGRGIFGNPNPLDLATMNKLAELTGGLVFYNKDNGIENSIRTAVDDGEITYTLGFYPQEDQSATWRQLKVTVARRGVSLRYRRQYFCAAATPNPVDDRPALQQLLKDSLDTTQLILRASAERDPLAPGIQRIRVNVDLHDLQLNYENGRHAGMVDISWFATATGKLTTRTFKIDIPDEQFATFLESGLAAVEPVEVTGQLGSVRIVAQDRISGAAGSVTLQLGSQ